MSIDSVDQHVVGSVDAPLPLSQTKLICTVSLHDNAMGNMQVAIFLGHTV